MSARVLDLMCEEVLSGVLLWLEKLEEDTIGFLELSIAMSPRTVLFELYYFLLSYSNPSLSLRRHFNLLAREEKNSQWAELSNFLSRPLRKARETAKKGMGTV